MTLLSVVLWGLLIFVSVGPLVSPFFGPTVVSVANAIGFNLMMIWFAGAFYLVKKRA
jgi:sorbitol-specific phosphotransferase system component IIBC